MRTLKHNQAHISTQYVMGKEIAENPQISVYYNDIEHVTVHSTILLTSTQYYLQKVTHKLTEI